MQKADQKNALSQINLNPAQKKAVVHKGSPLLVIAGPGSGKTRVITERVVELVNSGIKPSEILCLTFTEKAAEEMEQRLEKRVDTAEMDIRTFHSIAKTILEDNVLESGVGIASGIIQKSAQLAWGLKNIDNFEFEYIEIGNNVNEVIESIMDGISTFKDELITPEELDKYCKTQLKNNLSDEDREFIQRLSDLCKVYHYYQKFLLEKSIIDFDGLVVQVIKLFKNKPHVLEKYHKKYKHILVDEFQDNNFAQLEIVKLLAKDGNVTVVGDDDQSIFRFQGAYLTNFKDFTKHFPKTTEIILEQNYRSTQNIVKLAQNLFDNLPKRKPKKLFSKNEVGDKIIIARCANESAEVEFVVKTIKKLLDSPVKRRGDSKGPLDYKDFVILSRTKNGGKKFAKSLKAHGLPARFVGESNIFVSSIVKDLMAYFKIANSPTTSGIEIFRLMQEHGVAEQNIAKINYTARQDAKNDDTDNDHVFETLKNCDNLGITQKDEIIDLVKHIRKAIDLKKLGVSDIVYQTMMSITDLYKKTLSFNTPQNKTNRLLLNEIYNIALDFESINQNGTLEDFIKYLSLIGGFDLELKEGIEFDNAIQVSTIHKAKGKEFPIVFIVDVGKGKLPLRYRAKKFYVPPKLAKGLSRTENEKELYIEEERRLFYVAMTRAQNNLFITYAKRYGQNIRETKPSPFLDEINFEDNPLVAINDFAGTQKDTVFEPEDRIEKITHDLQEKAARSIHQLNLKTAIQRIIELAKTKHFEEFGSLKNFDPKDVLQVDNIDSNLEENLRGNHVPLFKKEDLRLSPSKIKTFENCPLQYKFGSILRIPTRRESFFDIGTAVHAVAEHLTKLQIDGINPTKKNAIDILDKEWISSTFESKTQEKQARDKAEEMIETFLKWSKENKNTPIAVEKKFKLEIEGVPFSGKIDRVEKTPDGNYEVVDFKTGSVYVNPTSIKKDIQMNVYALGVEKLYGKLPVKASLFYLKEDEIVPYDVEKSLVSDVKDLITDYVKAILNEEFDATPDYQTCNWCSFKNICDEKDVEN